MEENKMGTQPMLGLIAKMSLPAMFSMLIQSLYNVVDSIFVAQIGENALTAVSLAYPVQTLMIAFGVGTGVGLNSLISRRLGEKNASMTPPMRPTMAQFWALLPGFYSRCWEFSLPKPSSGSILPIPPSSRWGVITPM